MDINDLLWQWIGYEFVFGDDEEEEEEDES
jgi:hypothetical protein